MMPKTSRTLFTLLTLTSLAVPALATDWFQLPFGATEPSTTTVASGSEQEGGGAMLRLLDKNTNRLKDFTLKAGASTAKPLVITLRRCVKDVQGVPGQDVAWVDITEPTSNETLYSGWMFNFYPDVATLEHPRYDVRLVSCARAGGLKPKPVPVKKPTIKDDTPSAAIPDSEAPTDGNDPNYVPGVGNDDAAPANPLHDLMDGGAMPERDVNE